MSFATATRTTTVDRLRRPSSASCSPSCDAKGALGQVWPTALGRVDWPTHQRAEAEWRTILQSHEIRRAFASRYAGQDLPAGAIAAGHLRDAVLDDAQPLRTGRGMRQRGSQKPAPRRRRTRAGRPRSEEWRPGQSTTIAAPSLRGSLPARIVPLERTSIAWAWPRRSSCATRTRNARWP